ncbi:ABC transporter ATP-binding protein [Lysinibacillus sp. NPDC094403]|uniref:ABC transporter ATP-binding protein n=1 Tax=Lysinibacillus sp. NPDC094403 TaxID=3390581 RepID=UPI003D015A61
MSNILTLSNVTKSYKNTKVINNVSFSVPKGEVIGLVGPNGAGKTTLMRIIMGLITKFEGEVQFNIEKQSLPQSHGKRIGGLIEYPSFYPHMSGMDNLIYFSEISGGFDKDSVLSIIHLLGIEGFIYKKVKKYSLGMKQRLGIAQALINNPKLLILDEPTNGLDPEGVAEIREILEKVSKEKGISILISSHILSEIEAVCDKVLFLKKGTVVDYIDLKTEKQTEREIHEFIIESKKIEMVKKFLIDVKKIPIIEIDQDKIKFQYVYKESELLIVELVNNKISINAIYPLRKDLEKKFFELMGGNKIE